MSMVQNLIKHCKSWLAIFFLDWNSCFQYPVLNRYHHVHNLPCRFVQYTTLLSCFKCVKPALFFSPQTSSWLSACPWEWNEYLESVCRTESLSPLMQIGICGTLEDNGKVYYVYYNYPEYEFFICHALVINS